MSNDFLTMLKEAEVEADEAILINENTPLTRAINEIVKVEKDFIYGNSKSRKPDIKKIIAKTYISILEDS